MQMTDINPELVSALWIYNCIRAAAAIPKPLDATGGTSPYAARDYAWHVVSLARTMTPDLAKIGGKP